MSRSKDWLNQPNPWLLNERPLTIQDFVQGGELIVGSVGVGKTSPMSKQAMRKLMRAGTGELILPNKEEL